MLFSQSSNLINLFSLYHGVVSVFEESCNTWEHLAEVGTTWRGFALFVGIAFMMMGLRR